MVNLTRAKDAAVAASRAVSRPGKTRDDSAPENTTQAITTAVPAAPQRIVIVIQPTASGRKWAARLGDRVLCVSAWPFVKSARLLLDEGYPADAVIEMWRPNATDWAIRGRLGAVAATVIDGERGSRRAKNRSPARETSSGFWGWTTMTASLARPAAGVPGRTKETTHGGRCRQCQGRYYGRRSSG
jgi:hypothetical protein